MSQQPSVDRDGFPEFDRDPVALPDLPERPSPMDLARAYGTVVLVWCREWPRMIDALYWLRGAVMAAKSEAQAARNEAHGARMAAQGSRAAALPSMHEYNPDLTPGGGIHVSPEAWTSLQQRLAIQDEARKIAEARASGAQAALADLEAAQKKRRQTILFWSTVLGPFALLALTGIGALIAHLAHL